MWGCRDKRGGRERERERERGFLLGARGELKGHGGRGANPTGFTYHCCPPKDNLVPLSHEKFFRIPGAQLDLEYQANYSGRPSEKGRNRGRTGIHRQRQFDRVSLIQIPEPPIGLSRSRLGCPVTQLKRKKPARLYIPMMSSGFGVGPTMPSMVERKEVVNA
ncbi:uncharacterized protein LOC125479181 [Pyrus x bretschneideri]|uniref:uncharacterized protein LOC125479181 n=1 Tax=Pyrus x bretschneideri TaxID=225117 RepID=UPI002030AC9B|nr:uncharacterized protein LOC125479181 [Pyrus x bretschneideri]